MTPRIFSRIALLLAAAALLTLAAPAVSAQVAVVPGDSYFSPVKVKLNGNAEINGVQNATLQIGGAEETDCDVDDSSEHSVWFSFTLGSSAVVDIDTAGTFYATANYVTDALVLTVYRMNGLVLEEEECDSDAGPRLVGVALDAGSYRIRVASEVSEPVIAPSRARVSVRLREYAQLLEDPGFDDPLGDPWKVKNAGDPPAITKTCSINCYAAFGGMAGATLKQSVTLPLDDLKIKTGDYLYFAANFDDTPVGGSDIKFVVKIVYSDGTPTTKATVVRHVTQVGSGGITIGAGFFSVEFASKAATKVTVSISSPTDADSFNLHHPTLKMEAGGSSRDVLPLPPKP